MTFIPSVPITVLFDGIAGLLRCGKSCRLRWTNYLRPDIKRGPFSTEEEKLVVQLHAILGNRCDAKSTGFGSFTINHNFSPVK